MITNCASSKPSNDDGTVGWQSHTTTTRNTVTNKPSGGVENKLTPDMTQMRQEEAQAWEENKQLARVVEKAEKEMAHRLTEIEKHG